MSTASLFARAERAIAVARMSKESGFYDEAISRAYYAMFYAAEAVLLSKALVASTHSGVATLLYEHFVRTGLFDASVARMLSRAAQKRQSADYAHTFVSSKEEAELLLHEAHTFVEACRQLLAGSADAH